MSILVLAEHDNAVLKPATANTVAAATALAGHGAGEDQESRQRTGRATGVACHDRRRRERAADDRPRRCLDQASHGVLHSVWSRSMPKMYMATFSTVNTPALTTATAWSSALTGVGATIAAGSQR